MPHDPEVCFGPYRLAGPYGPRWRQTPEGVADVRHVWEVCKQVVMGVTPEGALKEAIRRRDRKPIHPRSTASWPHGNA